MTAGGVVVEVLAAADRALAEMRRVDDARPLTAADCDRLAGVVADLAETLIAIHSSSERQVPDSEIKVEHVGYERRIGPPDLRTPVRATHLPTGISVICDEHRAQSSNKAEAIRRLRILVVQQMFREAPAGRYDGLIGDEGAVMDHLCLAATAFGRMPRQHPDEARDFVDAIHRAQDLLAVRIARRAFPRGWPTYDTAVAQPAPQEDVRQELNDR